MPVTEKFYDAIHDVSQEVRDAITPAFETNDDVKFSEEMLEMLIEKKLTFKQYQAIMDEYRGDAYGYNWKADVISIYAVFDAVSKVLRDGYRDPSGHSLIDYLKDMFEQRKPLSHDINFKHPFHGTLLTHILWLDDIDLLQDFTEYTVELKLKLDVEAGDSAGMTPLMYAAEYASMDVFDAVLSLIRLSGIPDAKGMKKSVNAIDIYGRSVLHHAAADKRFGYKKIDELLRLGADKTCKDQYGKTPREHAQSQMRAENAAALA